MTITGVVFAVLLSGLQESLDTHIAWVNFVVHTLQADRARRRLADRPAAPPPAVVGRVLRADNRLLSKSKTRPLHTEQRQTRTLRKGKLTSQTTGSVFGRSGLERQNAS